APLCPAGHLPHKGGDWQLLPRSPSFNVGDWRKQGSQRISPQVGEMSGRTEGGAKEHPRRWRQVLALEVPCSPKS
ncbi:MAG: endonuclease domain-containing protein, partial [Mesorhizobium sp.]